MSPMRAKRPDRNPRSPTFRQEEQTACAKRPDRCAGAPMSACAKRPYRNPISSTFK